MNKQEYEELVRLLAQMEGDERFRIRTNQKGPIYRSYVEVEIMVPIQRVRELAELRAKQLDLPAVAGGPER